MLVDSHCHLDFPEFAPELDAVVARARAAERIAVMMRCPPAELAARFAEWRAAVAALLPASEAAGG